MASSNLFFFLHVEDMFVIIFMNRKLAVYI